MSLYGFIGEVLFFIGWAMTTFGLWIRVCRLEYSLKKLDSLTNYYAMTKRFPLQNSEMEGYTNDNKI